MFNRVIEPKKNPDKMRNIMALFDSFLFNKGLFNFLIQKYILSLNIKLICIFK
jgi:hypothetical protein